MIGGIVGGIYPGGFLLDTIIVVSDSDFQYYKSSLNNGGIVTEDIVNTGVVGDLFPNILGAESSTGSVTYRKIFVKNNNARLTFSNVFLWISQLTTSGNDEIDIGLGTDTDIDGSIITYTRPTIKGSGLNIGNLTPGESRGIWVRRTVTPSTLAENNIDSQIRVEGDNSGTYGRSVNFDYRRRIGYLDKYTPRGTIYIDKYN